MQSDELIFFSSPLPPFIPGYESTPFPPMSGVLITDKPTHFTLTSVAECPCIFFLGKISTARSFRLSETTRLSSRDSNEEICSLYRS